MLEAMNMGSENHKGEHEKDKKMVTVEAECGKLSAPNQSIQRALKIEQER